ncbi:MAG: AAA family ATPase [Thermoanaerobaculia bacterium]
MSTNGRLTVTWDEYEGETAPCVPSLWGDALLVRAGGYMIVGSDTGVGKTTLIANLIFSAADARDEFLGFPLPGRAVPALILEAEGNRYRFRDRIGQIAKNLGLRVPPPIHFHALNTELQIEGPNLETMIAETAAEIVFLDPIGRFWSGNENDATEWRAGVTTPLAKLGAALNVATIVSDHYSKPNENRSGQHRLRGSAAKLQDCGSAMRLEYGRGGGRSRILYFDRVRDGALPFPDRDPSRLPLEFDIQAGTVRLDEREDADLGTSAEPRLQDVRRFAQALGGPGGKVSTAMLRLKIQSELDLEKSRAKDLITAAVRGNVIESAGHGYYRLPGGIK